MVDFRGAPYWERRRFFQAIGYLAFARTVISVMRVMKFLCGD